MTRSIYDPTGDDAARGREGFLGPQARQASKMPPNLADGKATDEESPHEDAHREPMDDADPASPPSPAPPLP
jgi:hypothetical protein